MSEFTRFREFYPYYLDEHRNRVCRRLHFIGSTLVILIVLLAIVSGELRWLWLAPVAGYGFAWVGHYVYEKNRPATFRHPLYSLMGDWVMYWQVLSGKVKL
jgi:Predicted membrane protein